MNIGEILTTKYEWQAQLKIQHSAIYFPNSAWKYMGNISVLHLTTNTYDNLNILISINIIFQFFVSFPTWYTLIFPFYIYNFLYMFRTSWSIIRRIKLHVQPLAPFPHSLLSRAWPLVLTQLAPTATHKIATNEGKVPEAARVIWFSWWWTSRSETCRENCKIVNVKREK